MLLLITEWELPTGRKQPEEGGCGHNGGSDETNIFIDCPLRGYLFMPYIRMIKN